jgi:hypothetical protein
MVETVVEELFQYWNASKIALLVVGDAAGRVVFGPAAWVASAPAASTGLDVEPVNRKHVSTIRPEPLNVNEYDVAVSLAALGICFQ